LHRRFEGGIYKLTMKKEEEEEEGEGERIEYR
jgi:hypothetical protein